MYMPRSSGVRISCDYMYQGHRMAVLENEILSVTLLLDQGCSIVEFRYKPLDLDLMYRSPWGMRKWGSWVPTTANPRGSWIDHYPGGWQVIFPSGSTASDYLGAQQGMHGEASLMRWDFEIVEDSSDEVVLLTWVETQRLPFRIERELRLRRERGALSFTEKVTNLSPEPLHCMWGQHPALGEPFLCPELKLYLPQCQISSATGGQSETKRTLPGAQGEWPFLPGTNGMPVDLRAFPSRTEKCSDMLFASELSEGWVAACNPRLRMGFGLSWPLEIWPYLWLWQELQGSRKAPWFGRAYTIGLEPFSSLPDSQVPGLQGAVGNGTALMLNGGESRTAKYHAVAFPYTGKLKRIKENGEVEQEG